jgi:hemerythrin-like domain-containing protein
VLTEITLLGEAVQPDSPVELEPFLQLHAFIKIYADGVHHGKEERVLFRDLARAGVTPATGAMNRMLHEHALGRKFTEAMGDATQACLRGEPGRQKEMVDSALAYCRLMSAHIEKEDEAIYPLAQSLLGSDGLDALPGEFAEVDHTTPEAFASAARGVVRAARSARKALTFVH